MKLPFLANSNSVPSAAKSSWAWPYCQQPRTQSFRSDDEDSLFKINSAYETPECWLSTNSNSESPTFDSTASASASDDESGLVTDPVETVIRGLRSESSRLFFEPGDKSLSILEEAKTSESDIDDDDDQLLTFKETTAVLLLSMESQNPYIDFRNSMEEMVDANGLKDWEGLENLLCWYLSANGKINHGYIVAAFVDLLLGLATSATTGTTTSIIPSYSNYTSSSSSSSSSTTTPCSTSSLEAGDRRD